jgi:hypothetical protein
VLVLAAGAYVRTSFLEVRRRGPDERMYTLYAREVARTGRAGVATVVSAFNSVGLLRLYPRPTRVGHYAPVGLAMRLGGFANVAVTALFSTVASLLALLVLARLATATWGPWGGVVCVGFAAAAPIDLAIAQRAWGDGILALVALLMLLAYRRFLGRPARLGWLAVVLVLGGYGVLVKESGLVVLGLATLGLGWYGFRLTGTWRPVLVAVGGAALVGAAVLALLVFLCGGYAAVVGVFRTPPGLDVPPSPYYHVFDSGGLGYYPRGLWALQPVSSVLGALAAVLVLARARFLLGPLDRPTQAFLTSVAWFVLLYGAVAFWVTNKNLRILSPIYGPLALLAAVLVLGALDVIRRRARRPVFFAAIAACAVLLCLGWFFDLERFVTFFVRQGIRDLATPFFLDAG